MKNIVGFFRQKYLKLYPESKPQEYRGSNEAEEKKFERMKHLLNKNAKDCRP